jgi:hypothetical protein
MINISEATVPSKYKNTGNKKNEWLSQETKIYIVNINGVYISSAGQKLSKIRSILHLVLQNPELNNKWSQEAGLQYNYGKTWY